MRAHAASITMSAFSAKAGSDRFKSRPEMSSSRGIRASRAKSAAIQILKTAELKPEECKRPIITQFHTSKIKFPLPHRVAKTPKEFKTTFKASAPTTFC